MRWWRVFINKLAGPSDAPPSQDRRRRHERYGYRVKLAAKCSSWPGFVDLFTGDVSEGGVFVPTDQEAEIGETVQLDVTLPNGTTFALSGTVANVLAGDRAAEAGKPPGLGIMLDPLSGTSKEVFTKLLAAARAGQPRPAETLESGHPEPPKPPPIPASPATKPRRLETASLTEALQSAGEAPVSRETPLPGPPPLPPSRPLTRHRDQGPIVGIDLGTTNTSVAAVVGKTVTILAQPDGSKAIPSVVSFDRDGSILVGTEAKRRISADPMRTVASPKRVLGRRYDEREVQAFTGQCAFRCLEGPDGSVVAEIAGEKYAIPQIISYILADARKLAESKLGCEIRQAVVSVPISFDDARVEALRRAARLAGLELAAVIDEPSAAALANRFDPGFGGVVGVYDFGGGTFDFSVVDVSRGDFQVMATAGDTWLGGDDLDRVLAEAAANQFWRQHKVDLRKQVIEWQRLLAACERAKRDLSAADSAVISVPEVLRTADGMIGLHLSLDRATFERACAPIIARSLETCGEALSLLEMQPGDLSAVYLSGGTTYVPAVREALKRHFGVPVRTGVPPEYAVCLGAAIHAAQIQFHSAQTLDAR